MRVRMNRVLYLAPDGSDTNSGVNPALPKRTIADAVRAMGGAGLLVLAAGIYLADSVSLAICPQLEIRGTNANILLGERVDTFDTLDNITWFANILTVIPDDIADNKNWVFEWGTPEGVLDATNSTFAPAGRTHRMQHFRMKRGASANSLAPGEFFYESGTLYIRRAFDANPNNAVYWVPSQTPGTAFLHSATSSTNLTLSGVNVFFGYHGVSLSNAGSYALTNCLFFGSGHSGVNYNGVSTTGAETDCEYAANAFDGRNITCADSVNRITSTVTGAWAHDNADEGVSDHNVGSFSTYSGGLYEYNDSGGLTWVQGAPIVMTSPHTRYNGAGLTATINQQAVTITGWLSEFDGIAAYASSNGVLTFSNSTILSPVTYALYAGAPGDIINATNTAGVTTPRAGGGTFNVT